MEAAGARPGADGVDENRSLGIIQQVDKICPRTISDDYLAVRRRREREDSRDFQTDGVIAKRAAYSDDPDQPASISSLRKCVEHEMHGS